METNSDNQQPQPNLSSPQIPSSLNPSPNQKGNFLIPITLIFLILVIGIGAYYLGTQKSRTLVNDQQSQLTPSLTQPASINNVIDDWNVLTTEDWKSYYNNDLKFSIKYPKDWFLVPGSWKRIGGSWGGSATYLANKEDKEYGKSLDERTLPIDNTNLCAISINPVALDGKKLDILVREWRGDQDTIQTRFKDTEAIYIPLLRKHEQSGKIEASEFWFLGGLSNHAYYIQMQSDPDLLETCRKYFHTIIATYK